MKKSFSDRIRVTKNKKLLRRGMGVNHFRSKKSAASKARTRKLHGVGYPHLMKNAHAVRNS
ncbi:MAG: hypothetical protein HYS43_00360 [Candidatus Liptonbacteria bacterium]|nr:hypothetical protein [Candidatus Liptonbacteria bacterium]